MSEGKGSYSQVVVSLFSQLTSGRMRGNGLESCQGRFRFDVWKKLVMKSIFKEGAVQGSDGVTISEDI